MHVWLLFDIDRWSLRDAFETNVLAPSWVFPFRLTPLYVTLCITRYLSVPGTRYLPKRINEMFLYKKQQQVDNSNDQCRQQQQQLYPGKVV